MQFRGVWLGLVTIFGAMIATPAAADDDDQPPIEVADPAQPDDDESSVDGVELDTDGDTIVIVATRSRRAIVEDHRAVSVVDAEQLWQRAPRNTPEALHFAPGVSVQQTNYGGGSAYIRGRTGQQTLIMIDGFRLNTSIMRSGPNQYLNTVNGHTLERAEVLRGSGSVLYGSDAIGGVVNLVTIDPADGAADAGVHMRAASADRSGAVRGEGEGPIGPVRVRGGVSARHFDDLRGGGPMALAEVPSYDGDTQLFTGYDDLAGDLKARTNVGTSGEVVAAANVYRQFDAPRTDKCTPDPLECRFFAEQFYDFGYLRYSGDVGSLREVDIGTAVARTHERRRRVRTSNDAVEHELDRVLTVALTARASLPTWKLGTEGAMRLSFGAETYRDGLSSEATDEVLSTGAETMRARGKYIDGSSYLTGAAFGFGELVVDETLSFTAGLRVSGARASVAADPEAGTAAFTQTTGVPVASVGARMRLVEGLFLVGNVNQGFRAPNLDDLTARSSEGPGYQLPNPDLEPESSITFEAGVTVERGRVAGAVYGYETFVDGAITRDATTCPTELSAECGDADNVFVLVNADESRSQGVEASISLSLPEGLSVFATVTYTRSTRHTEGSEPEPESKIPPLHGLTGVRMDFGGGKYFVESVAYWAARQDRLSPADIADKRIPPGGTPAYGVVDVRVGALFAQRFRATLAIGNLSDTRYRVHGSGVDGAGFGVIASISGRLQPL
jgi:iron complex outermembrane receptor protein/hemoglobin/transferrin/lactoferrin receptor protein